MPEAEGDTRRVTKVKYDGGRPVTVTIDQVVIEHVGGQDDRPVCSFEGKQKGLILNKTNARSITAIAGTPETDRWPGVRIQLIVMPVEYQGQMVDAIRVRAVPNERPASPAPSRPSRVEATREVTSEDIPF